MQRYEYELYHYGIKGMKWGVRKVKPRYNSDGTLTPYGKKYKERLEKRTAKRKARDEKEYRRTHNEDGSFNETAQREHFKALKKGKKPVELYKGYDDDDYREAINRRRAASDLGEALNGGMVPKKLRSDDLWDRSDEDWDKAHEIIEKKNREVVDNFLGKYKDQYLSSYDKKHNMNAGKRFAYEYERIASNFVSDDRTYNKYFLDYFDHSASMSDELYHHGIKGQKHGVRRWQNKDGSLTPAGRIRYGAAKVGEKVSSSIKKRREERRIEKLRKKPLSKLTDAELKERIARLAEEKKASDLQNQISDIDQNRLSMGKKFTQAALTKVVAPAAVDAGKEVLTKWLKKQGMDIAGLGEVKDAYSMIKKEADVISKQRQISDDQKKIRENALWNKKQDEKEARDEEHAKKAIEVSKKTVKEAEEAIRKGEEFATKYEEKYKKKDKS